MRISDWSSDVCSSDLPVDHPDAVEAAVGSLLQLCDVLVVDPEAQLAHGLVGPAHEAEQRVREGQLAVDAVGLELADASLAVVGARPAQRVVLHQHCGELLRQAGLPAAGQRTRATLVAPARTQLLARLRDAPAE